MCSFQLEEMCERRAGAPKHVSGRGSETEGTPKFAPIRLQLTFELRRSERHQRLRRPLLRYPTPQWGHEGAPEVEFSSIRARGAILTRGRYPRQPRFWPYTGPIFAREPGLSA